jgi:nucleotide-binding universal stress UspA family protein
MVIFERTNAEKMKNILIPLELNQSNLEKKIIQEAISLAKMLNAKCWLIHVAAPDPDFVGYEVGPQYIRDSLAEDLREEHREIQKISGEFQKSAIDAEALLIQGATAEIIEVEIKKLSIDLLILGNKKHSFIDIFFRGSVTDQLMDEANIPILLIPDNA